MLRLPNSGKSPDPIPAPVDSPSTDEGMGFSAPMPPSEPPAMPQDNMGGMDDPNDFGADFDAGVEANEETDPKKYIQQLTGKLAQSLRKYNSQLPQPDVDLDKYVAGMVVKQAIEGLDQNDVKDILDKLDKGEDMDNPDNGENMGNFNNGGQEPDAMQNPQQPGQEMSMNEQMSERAARLDNLYNDYTGNKNSADPSQPNTKTGRFSAKPYTAPAWK